MRTSTRRQNVVGGVVYDDGEVISHKVIFSWIVESYFIWILETWKD
jgi:hypothetical protein